jgi:hypothetical protein
LNADARVLKRLRIDRVTASAAKADGVPREN